MLKYGFELKQWFVNSGNNEKNHSSATSWCTNIGYRVPKAKELTNASCQGRDSGAWCQGAVGATPSSPNNWYRRHIGAGFITEWGGLNYYRGANFFYSYYYNLHYWTQDRSGSSQDFFWVNSEFGSVGLVGNGGYDYGLCAYP